MATKHYTFSVPITTVVPQSNPTEIATPLDPGEVFEIIVFAPPFANTGIAFAVAHQIVIPYTGSDFIIGTGTSQNFTLNPEGAPVSGQWSVFGWNTNATGVDWHVIYGVRVVRPRLPRTQLRRIAPVEITETLRR